MPRPGLTAVVAGILLGLALLWPAPAVAQTEVFGLRLEGDVEAGGRVFLDGLSRKKESKLEEYRDIPDGLFLHGLDLRLSTRDDRYLVQFKATEAGEQDQNYLLRSMRLGRYEFEFEWDQTPHVFSNTGATVYNQTRRGVYDLQGRPYTAATLPDLLARASSVDIETRWDTARVLFKLTPTPDWDLSAEWARIRKEGDRPFVVHFGSPGGNIVEALEPIEQTIHDLRLSASIARQWWQLEFRYHLSLFTNDLDALIVANPLSTGVDVVATASRGRVALPPDNVAHTVTLAGAVNLPLRSRLTSTLSYGMRFQNEAFLPHTSNSALATNPLLALPAESLDGEVRTQLANVQLTSRPVRDVSLTARYNYFDFDNETPVLTFPARVRTDQTVFAGPFHNEPYSYTKQNAGGDVGWRPWSLVSVKAGFGWEQWQRDTREREVGETQEHTPKVSLDLTPWDWLLLRGSYARSWRERSKYARIVDVQLPLLRKYDVADRERDRVDVLAQLTPLDTVTFTATYSLRQDDYDRSPYGLQSDDSWAAGLDVNWSPSERLALFAGYMREEFDARLRSRQRSATVDNPANDWEARNRDRVDTVSFGADAALIPRKLDLRLSYNLSLASAKMRNVSPSTPTGGMLTASDFPEVKEKLHQVEASLRYRITNAWSARLRYLLERFDQEDFRTDSMRPYMGGSDIFLGATTPSYVAHILSLTLAYHFR